MAQEKKKPNTKEDLARIYNIVKEYYDVCPELNDLTIADIKKQCKLNGWKVKYTCT
jgi:hypothetical protein